MYEPSLGAILSSMDGKSTSRPGSYSIVVRDAVDPGTKRNTTPLLMVPFSTIVGTLSVMSSISPSSWVATLTTYDSTLMLNPLLSGKELRLKDRQEILECRRNAGPM